MVIALYFARIFSIDSCFWFVGERIEMLFDFGMARLNVFLSVFSSSLYHLRGTDFKMKPIVTQVMELET